MQRKHALVVEWHLTTDENIEHDAKAQCGSHKQISSFGTGKQEAELEINAKKLESELQCNVTDSDTLSTAHARTTWGELL